LAGGEIIKPTLVIGGTNRMNWVGDFIGSFCSRIPVTAKNLRKQHFYLIIVIFLKKKTTIITIFQSKQ